MMSLLARNWWAFALRGALAIAFGLVVFAYPQAALLSFALLFAAYAIADGLFAIMAAVRTARAGGHWSLLALQGAIGLLAGIAAMTWPGLTVLIFVALIGFWALTVGILMVLGAFKADHGRWWLAICGLVSVGYGIVLASSPMTGALVVTWWIGSYALIFGVALLVLAFRLRARHVAAGSRQPA